ncbi:MAG: hypothetical protein ICV62_16715, partial [Cyanobacteria bacterium Co-bin13]|nr:hypothetical protein [Cyanobacteria bacterium Co-bin13]
QGIAVLLVLTCQFLAVSGIEAASPCRQVKGHQVCILTIQRSAKYFWEYRAAVSVDGEKRPLEKYDCRQQVRLRKDGKSIPFAQDEAGELICGLVR